MKRALAPVACALVWALSSPAADGSSRPISKDAPPAGRSKSAEFLAGAHRVDITPPRGVPLAGYGGVRRRLVIPDLLNRHPYAFWFKPSSGVHDPIMARALVLEGAGRRVLWITVDLVGTDSQMVHELRQRLRARTPAYHAIILSASHTHSGPGAFSSSGLFGFLALDRLVPAVRERILQAMTEAAEAAERNKAPARVGVGRGEAPGLTRSRLGLPLDPEIGVLKLVRRDGRPLALLWNYAIHGTTLGKANRLLSGDVTGMASQTLERGLGVPVLYTNGAVADVSPARRGWSGARQTAEVLAKKILDIWAATALEPSPRLHALSRRIALPPPRLSVKNCLGRWVPRWLTIGLGWGFPRESEMVGLAVGASAWVTIPGELQTRLGRAVKAAGRRRFSRAFVVGLSNGYAGYFLTPEDYDRPSYVACASLYGDGGGRFIAEQAGALLERLGDGVENAGAGQ